MPKKRAVYLFLEVSRHVPSRDKKRNLPNELSGSERSDKEGTFCMGPGILAQPSLSPPEGADCAEVLLMEAADLAQSGTRASSCDSCFTLTSMANVIYDERRRNWIRRACRTKMAADISYGRYQTQYALADPISNGPFSSCIIPVQLFFFIFFIVSQTQKQEKMPLESVGIGRSPLGPIIRLFFFLSCLLHSIYAVKSDSSHIQQYSRKQTMTTMTPVLEKPLKDKSGSRVILIKPANAPHPDNKVHAIFTYPTKCFNNFYF